MAFHGNPAVKATLLARIDRHLAAGTLVFANTAWDGERGSPSGVTSESVDPTVYSQLTGYPVALAPLLDALAANPTVTFDAPAFVRNWIAVVRPGAILSDIPAELMMYMLSDPRVAAADPVNAAMLIDLHRRDRGGTPPPRREWAAARQAILAMAAPGSTPAVSLMEAGAWPAASGRSSLTSAFAAWRRLQAMIDDPTWPPEDERRKEEIFEAMWTEQAPARAAGTDISYHTLLVERDPDLAERFLANLRRVNALAIGAAEQLAGFTIARLEAAHAGGDR
jgi:hypothetical protein